MQGEGSAFFQHAQGLQQDRLPVPAGDVVVDIIRDDGVERPIREVQLLGITLSELRAVPYSFNTGILLAE